jgi:hypothetical protein
VVNRWSTCTGLAGGHSEADEQPPFTAGYSDAGIRRGARRPPTGLVHGGKDDAALRGARRGQAEEVKAPRLPAHADAVARTSSRVVAGPHRFVTQLLGQLLMMAAVGRRRGGGERTTLATVTATSCAARDRHLTGSVARARVRSLRAAIRPGQSGPGPARPAGFAGEGVAQLRRPGASRFDYVVRSRTCLTVAAYHSRPPCAVGTRASLRSAAILRNVSPRAR